MSPSHLVLVRGNSSNPLRLSKIVTTKPSKRQPVRSRYTNRRGHTHHQCPNPFGDVARVPARDVDQIRRTRDWVRIRLPEKSCADAHRRNLISARWHEFGLGMRVVSHVSQRVAESSGPGYADRFRLTRVQQPETDPTFGQSWIKPAAAKLPDAHGHAMGLL